MPRQRQRLRKGRPVHGWINLDKPYELGSTKAVGRVRWLYQAQKAGHAGTLDPLATGILPIALGEATKTAPFLVDADKAYTFTLTFGAETSTADVEGEITRTSDHRPSESDLRAVLPDFLGDITQVPPRYSAIKIDGQRAYDLARAGQDVTIPARQVRVDALTLNAFEGDTATLSLTCGKGTYVRSLAVDLARALGTCGHVSALRRTRVGPFHEADAATLEQLEADSGRDAALRPLITALGHLPHCTLSDEDLIPLGFGRALSVAHPDADEVAALHEGEVMAIGRVTDGLFHPRRVLQRGALASDASL